jgi:Na+-translocating ferredoxin:NAD+ oxidoreductase RnfG subunit
VIRILFFIVVFSARARAETLVDLKTYLKEQLSGAEVMSKETFSMTPAQKQELAKVAQDISEDTFTFYYGKDKGGKLQKACAVIAQAGKEGPMRVGSCFDPAGKVLSVTILEFQEERGQKVKEQSFLKQFVGKTIASGFQVGKDIDGISGATISSKAVSEALRKASFGFKTFVRR